MRVKFGFALLQISIFGAFFATCAGVLTPSVAAVVSSAREARLAVDLQTMRSQLELYRIHHSGQLPPTTDSTVFKAAMLARGQDGRGPYLQKIPANPFNGNSNIRFEDGATTAGANQAGWVLDTSTGLLQPDDSMPHTGL